MCITHFGRALWEFRILYLCDYFANADARANEPRKRFRSIATLGHLPHPHVCLCVAFVISLFSLSLLLVICYLPLLESSITNCFCFEFQLFSEAWLFSHKALFVCVLAVSCLTVDLLGFCSVFPHFLHIFSRVKQFIRWHSNLLLYNFRHYFSSLCIFFSISLYLSIHSTAKSLLVFLLLSADFS